ncbi:hypothetical protein KCP76_20370 [Salmonella enterica subsp. enterica serovar Weltevreden]|nr:hypothetical protein KCP76_20370 [Salmonella enterica subsp. enterica serovar Weltevreden]
MTWYGWEGGTQADDHPDAGAEPIQTVYGPGSFTLVRIETDAAEQAKAQFTAARRGEAGAGRSQ